MEPNSAAADASVIIPQHNRAELTCRCIASLRAHETAAWPVIVADDGSDPEAAEAVSSGNFPATRLVRQPQRLGVSAAWNRGARAASSPYLVFLNNDVRFKGPAIERLVQPLRSGTCLVSGAVFRREAALPEEMLHRLPTAHVLAGWCLAVAAETFQNLGGFDEQMALYWSDTDFQLRTIRHFGRERTALFCVTNLPLNHSGHRTAHALPDHRRIWRRDREAFIGKWNGILAENAVLESAGRNSKTG